MKSTLELIREAYDRGPDREHYWDGREYSSDDLARFSMLRMSCHSHAVLHNALYVYEKHKGLVDVDDPIENMILAGALMIFALENRMRDHAAIESDDHDTAFSLVGAERHHQIVEKGHITIYDDNHVHGELALMAMYYACPDKYLVLLPSLWPRLRRNDMKIVPVPKRRMFTHQEQAKLLVNASALIVAEIERLQRAQLRKADK